MAEGVRTMNDRRGVHQSIRAFRKGSNARPLLHGQIKSDTIPCRSLTDRGLESPAMP